MGNGDQARLINKQLACRRYAYEHGIDDPEVAN